MRVAIKCGLIIDGMGSSPIANKIIVVQNDKIQEIIDEDRFDAISEAYKDVEEIDASQNTVLRPEELRKVFPPSPLYMEGS